MNHAENKVEWCLKKAEKELKEFGRHRGLIKIKPNLDEARKYIKKAEHYLKATQYLKKGDFSDISASTVFYSMYHSLLAIMTKYGYESRNQECTFALIKNLAEDGKITFDKKLLDKISSLETKGDDEKTSTEIREQYQYGVELSIKDKLYEELLQTAKEVLAKTKLILKE